MGKRSTIALVFALAGCAATPSEPVAEAPARVVKASAKDPCAGVTLPLQCDAIEEVVRDTQVDEATGIRTCETFCAADGERSGAYRAVLVQEPARVVSGTFRFGRRDGRWVTRLHDDRGPVVEVVNYMQGPRHGAYVQNYPDGSPREVGLYDRERRHGKWTVHAENGVVVSEENYVRGILVGTQITRHENGQLASERNFDESGRPDGRWCSWLPAGTELGCTEFVDGTGVGREYGPDGEMTAETPYLDGERHGTEVRHEGNRRIEIPWVRGVQTGVRLELVGECIAEEKSVEAGVSNGPYVERDCATGVELRNGVFCGGHFCGLWVHRAADGRVEHVAEYDALSMKLAEARFQDGKLVDFWTVEEQLRLQRAACYQAIAGDLCCDIAQQYRVSADCLTDTDPSVETTEL